MSFHQLVRRLLLTGAPKPALPAAPTEAPLPEALAEIAAAVSTRRRDVRGAAEAAGNSYRSAFWAIYLFSALAVLCAALPVALGWDSPGHRLSRYAGVWALLEIALISAVATLYFWGNKSNWQQKWIDARVEAELMRYLPMVTPLVDFSTRSTQANWYARVFDVDPETSPAVTCIDPLCTELEPLARSSLADAWSHPGFVEAYGRWVTEQFLAQVRYHSKVHHEAHQLTHRVHGLTLGLFALTATAALGHLVVHSAWLTVATIFFPALGAALHGALVQSESKRLEMVSGHLMKELGRDADRIGSLLLMPHSPERSQELRQVVVRAVDDILEEHEGWQMLVRQHSLIPA